MKHLFLALTLLLLPATALAHPHAFVEASVTVVFDDNGLAGFQQVWELDPMLSITVLDLIAENHDGTLDRDEVKRLEVESFSNIAEYKYFTDIRVDGKPFEIKDVRNFDAALKGGKVSYSFFVPCAKAAGQKPVRAQIALYDESFYTFIAYKNENKPGLDPTKDPLFGNMQAGPNPGDFDRFSAAVGDTSYDGEVYFTGPIEQFDVAAAVEQAPDMAYFYDQIIPTAFFVEFSTK